MGDIDRSQPMNHSYDHTDASLAPKKSLVDEGIDWVKDKLGIGSQKDGAKHMDPSGQMKTPQQIADDES